MTKKKNLPFSRFCFFSRPLIENKRKQKMKINTRQRTKKKAVVTVIPIVVGALGTIPPDLERRQEKLKKGESIEINNATSLLRLVRIPRRVLETREHSMKDHQLILARKNGKENNNNNNSNNNNYNKCHKTNHVKAKIDKKEQKSWCKLCDDRDETINLIISEFSSARI